MFRYLQKYSDSVKAVTSHSVTFAYLKERDAESGEAQELANSSSSALREKAQREKGVKNGLPTLVRRPVKH